MIWTPHISPEITFKFVAECVAAWELGQRMPYIVADRVSGKLLGMLDARVSGCTVDVGYVLARPNWRKGIMSEALCALADVVLSRPEFFRLQATCDVENIASIRLLEGSDFRREGRLERYTVHPNLSPEPRPCFMYARCR